MIAELVAGSFLLGEFIYNQYAQQGPPRPQYLAGYPSLPLTTEGTTVPLIYGTVRVRAPILAWCSRMASVPTDPDQIAQGRAPFTYGSCMFFVLGMGVQTGQPLNRLRSIYIGDTNAGMITGAQNGANGAYLSQLTGAGGITQTTQVTCYQPQLNNDQIGGGVEFLNGSTTQKLVDPVTGTPTTWAGCAMTGVSILPDSTSNGPFVDAFSIPGYRGLMCVSLFQGQTPLGVEVPLGWSFGSTDNLPPISFEVSSLQVSSLSGTF